jgi:hypothetical protein
VKVALIPPIPDLFRQPKTGIHLILSHLLEDDRYYLFYKTRRAFGDYLILDNSAHELGASQAHSLLLEQAASLRAQEVVLPDVLFDRRGTVERTKRMLKWLQTDEGASAYAGAWTPALMLVPQGSDRPEWTLCLKGLLQAWDLYAPKTARMVIGLSKDYDNWRGGLYQLIEQNILPLRKEKRQFDVHCLGWSNNLWSLAAIARDFPWVRSTDSAKPFVFAKQRILLEPGGPCPKYPRRDAQYFEESLPKLEWEIARRNILVYQAAASNELILKEEDAVA